MRRSDRKPTLSQRESDLIRFAADGHTDAQIAARLGISEATVGTYWGRVRVKIGPYSRTELVATVLRAQIDEELDSLHRENSRLVEALENSDSEIERLDQAILDDAPDAVILVDEGAVVRYANRFAHQLFGYDPGEMVGKSIQSFVPDRFAEVHLQHVADYLKEGESRMMGEHLDTAGKRKDGTEFRFRATLSMAKTPIGSLVTCVHRPIEEPESRQQ